MTNKTHFIFFILVGTLLTSCGSTKNLTYFQDAKNFENIVNVLDSTHYEIRIKTNDNLLITVSSRNPLAAEQFKPASSGQSSDWSGYLVDENGFINFPSIGKIHVEGMTKDELIDLLEKRVKAYFDDPVVNVRFLNYKVTVLGEVASPGVYTVSDEKITIPQALALAGDLTIYGQRDNVLICRQENGKKQFYTVDLRNPLTFSSPYYYLRQNDVIYVAPNKSQASRAAYNQGLFTIISVTSILFTIGTFVYTISNK